MKLIKSLKRFFVGEGRMMATFEAIQRAYRAADTTAIRAILATLKANSPPFWTPHYEKTLELIGLCQVLLATNPRARAEAAWRLGIIADPSHELGRKILALLQEISPYSDSNSTPASNQAETRAGAQVTLTNSS